MEYSTHKAIVGEVQKETRVSPNIAPYLESWLRKSVSTAVTDVEKQTGLIGHLYQGLFQFFSSLWIEVRDLLPKLSAKRYQDELERLFLWGDGLAVEQGDLDTALEGCSDLKKCVMSLLCRIGRDVAQGMSCTGQLLHNCNLLLLYDIWPA